MIATRTVLMLDCLAGAGCAAPQPDSTTSSSFENQTLELRDEAGAVRMRLRAS